MTPGQLRELIETAPIFKMSLGKSGKYEAEALAGNVLLFQSEARFYDAVVAGDEAAIRRAGARLVNDQNPDGNAGEQAIAIWRKTIGTFRGLPGNVLVLHWESDLGYLYWGITEGEPRLVRREKNDWGQDAKVFHRPLAGGWRRESIAGLPLTNLHPKARALAINRATLDEVRTDTGFFRALITDKDTAPWTSQPDWAVKAVETGWKARDVGLLLAERRRRMLSPMVEETADYFDAEIERMAATALWTAASANGQTVFVVIKAKDCTFTREQLEQEIAALLKAQGFQCALTGYRFVQNQPNPHLKTSLDRRDSALGYVAGNLQVVTRAANFFKSASDEADWRLKATAMEKMAIAMQRARKEVVIRDAEVAGL